MRGLWGTRAQQLWLRDLASRWHVESSWTRGQTRVLCVVRFSSTVPPGGYRSSVFSDAVIMTMNPEMSHFVSLCPVSSPVPWRLRSACLTHNNIYEACSEMFFILMKLMVVMPLCTPVLCALEVIFRSSFIVERVCLQLLSVILCVLLSCFSRVQLFVTPWTVAHQAPLSVGFPRQECWSGCCAVHQQIFLT